MRNKNISCDDTVVVASSSPIVLVSGYRNILGSEKGGDGGESVHLMWLRMQVGVRSS